MDSSFKGKKKQKEICRNPQLQRMIAEIKKIRHNEMFFEKQKEALCGLHAKNNALQYGLVSKRELFSVAINLKIELNKILFTESFEGEIPY